MSEWKVAQTITLRQWYAGQALKGLVEEPEFLNWRNEEQAKVTAKAIARSAELIADAMIERMMEKE